MIRKGAGNILDNAGYDIGVIPVNVVGVMGAGLARAWKEKFPWVFEPYKQACDLGRLKPGSVALLWNPSPPNSTNPNDSWVLLAATKDHWRDPSRVSWVRECLSNIGSIVVHSELNYGKRIKSVGLPLLGAGKGGLDVSVVKNEITAAHNKINANKHKSRCIDFIVFSGP